MFPTAIILAGLDIVGDPFLPINTVGDACLPFIAFIVGDVLIIDAAELVEIGLIDAFSNLLIVSVDRTIGEFGVCKIGDRVELVGRIDGDSDLTIGEEGLIILIGDLSIKEIGRIMVGDLAIGEAGRAKDGDAGLELKDICIVGEAGLELKDICIDGEADLEVGDADLETGDLANEVFKGEVFFSTLLILALSIAALGVNNSIGAPMLIVFPVSNLAGFFVSSSSK